MSEWINFPEKKPYCSRDKDALGTEVLIWPRPSAGNATAFYGRRVTGRPEFYKYGAVIHGVRWWKPLPMPPKE